ncbi:hypothetical protein HDU91_005468 [Kappamyces sp. JEL0680]|nr:hypothetical protein HDU91_005468 [Kappamyces sp. JEL0680]
MLSTQPPNKNTLLSSTPPEAGGESVESISALISTFLDNLSASQDVALMKQECKAPAIPFHELNDLQLEIQSAERASDQAKIELEGSKIDLARAQTQCDSVQSSLSHHSAQVTDLLKEKMELEKELEELEREEQKELPLDGGVLTMHLYQALGVEFFDWSEDQLVFRRGLAKSISANRIQSFPIEQAKYSRFYYPNLLWDLVSK